MLEHDSHRLCACKDPDLPSWCFFPGHPRKLGHAGNHWYWSLLIMLISESRFQPSESYPALCVHTGKSAQDSLLIYQLGWRGYLLKEPVAMATGVFASLGRSVTSLLHLTDTCCIWFLYPIFPAEFFSSRSHSKVQLLHWNKHRYHIYILNNFLLLVSTGNSIELNKMNKHWTGYRVMRNRKSIFPGQCSVTSGLGVLLLAPLCSSVWLPGSPCPILPVWWRTRSLRL